MEKIKIAQIGLCHAHGYPNLDNILKQKDIFDFVGLYLDYDFDDPDYCSQVEQDGLKARLNDIERAHGPLPKLTLDELLNYPGLEAVSVESYEGNLTKFALMAAERGLHIFMDKPGGESKEEFEKLISVMKEKNLVLHLGYMYRTNPAILETLAMVDKGALGEITSVEVHMDCLHTDYSRKWLGNFKGGMTYFLGCHLVDLIYRIKGAPRAIIPFNRETNMHGIAGRDNGFVVFDYDNGVSFLKTSAAELAGFMRRQLVVTGTEGSVEIKPLEYFKDGEMYTDIRVVTKRKHGEDWLLQGELKTIGPIERYAPMLRNFAKEIRGEYKNPYTLDYELELFRFIDQCCR